MGAIYHRLSVVRTVIRLTGAATMLSGIVPAIIWASPPREPLPVPLYSLDRYSPSQATCGVHPDALLQPGDLCPVELLPGVYLQLGVPGDDLDGLSTANPKIGSTAVFAVLFSVDRATMGAVPPDPQLVGLGVPFSAQDQASKGQGAADLFMTTMLFTRAGKVLDRDGRPPNNVLVINNFDEGGRDFKAQPPTNAQQDGAGQSQDNVDATTYASTNGTSRSGGRQAPLALYFSVEEQSPSLVSLPGSDQPSGAHVFFDGDVLNPQSETRLFARFEQLGLVQGDDIDALLVFDLNTNGVFDGADQVLFSLTPGSPSLLTIPGASSMGAAADIFGVTPGPPPLVSVFASAEELGLGGSAGQYDNVDALEFKFCSDSLVCADLHGIQYIPFDFDNDGDVDLADYDQFAACFTGSGGGPVPPECQIGDADRDGDIDCADWYGFVRAWTGPGQPPELPQCPAPIPTVSEWGLLALTLSILTAGTIIIVRRRPAAA